MLTCILCFPHAIIFCLTRNPQNSRKIYSFSHSSVYSVVSVCNKISHTELTDLTEILISTFHSVGSVDSVCKSIKLHFFPRRIFRRRIVEHLCSFILEIKWNNHKLLHGLHQLWLLFLFAVEQQETTATSPKQLTA